MSNKVSVEISKLQEAVGEYQKDIKSYYLAKARKEIEEVEKRAKKYIEVLKVESINQSLGGGDGKVLKENETLMFSINHNNENLQFVGGLLNENKIKMSLDRQLAHEYIWIRVESETLDLTHPLIFRNLVVSYKYDKSIVRHYGLEDLKASSRFQMIDEKSFKVALMINCEAVQVAICRYQIQNSPIMLATTGNCTERFARQTNCSNPTYMHSNHKEICLVDSSDNKIVIFNKNFEYLRETSKTRPRTALFFEDKLILSHKAGISIMNSEDFIEEQTLLGNYPCLTSHEEVIFAAEESEEDTRFIQIQRNSEGIFQKSYLRDFRLKNSKIRYMTYFKGNIYMTDMIKNTVIRLDLSTKETFKSSFNMKKPAGLYVNSDSVIICDRDNHKLISFTLDLQYNNVIFNSQNYLYPNCIINAGTYYIVGFQHTRGEHGPADGVVVGLSRL